MEQTKNSETIIVMCNGPSLKDVDFNSLNNFNTFGMNGAYRYYYKHNWWPRYFSCFDNIVTKNHSKNYKQMIEDPAVPIERVFLLQQITDHDKLTVLKLSTKRPQFSNNFATFGNAGNTGGNSCQTAICLGYKKIILLGADCNYVEVVDGAESIKIDNGAPKLIMKKTPDKNPNYFFDDYQQEGDLYNYPQAGNFHKPGWSALAKYAKETGIDIVNCSDISTLTCFRKSNLEKELSLIV